MLQKLQHNATWCNLNLTFFRVVKYVKFYFHAIMFYINFLLQLSIHGRCRFTAGRSALLPYGNKGYDFVQLGTVLACRCILLILVATYRKLRWVLEQPDSSILPALPQWQWLLGTVEARTILRENLVTDSWKPMFTEAICFKMYAHSSFQIWPHALMHKLNLIWKSTQMSG